MPNLISFMLYLEQFYRIPKNSRTIMYAKIFWFLRNYSIYQPKTNHIIRVLRASLLSISLNAILRWGLGFLRNYSIYRPKTNHIIRVLRALFLSISLNAILVWYLRFFKNCFIYKVYRYEQ